MPSYDFTIANLGRRGIASPIKLSKVMDDFVANYVNDDERVIYDIELSGQPVARTYESRDLLEKAGPREQIYFDPAKARAAIVTCGGLCPGLNDVIRSIVMCLWYKYGVRNISGIRFGYRGLVPEYGIPTMELNPGAVEQIHRDGGTILGSSRGAGNRTREIVDSLERMNLSMLFAIGGDGTQKGALAIADEAEQRGYKLAVIGIPKTIDNDLSFVQKSFGLETAVSVAVDAVSAAHTEAHDAINGIGIVQVMGRESGFIAAHTTLANSDVNFVLVPEVPFDLEGENGLLSHLEHRLARRNHAVILVAEGAGQDLMASSGMTDLSGNKKLADVGLFLKEKVAAHFREKGTEINLKYIDPSYIIRSAPANPNDSLYCLRLGTNAAHAAMAGKTKMLIGRINYHFVHVPIELAVSRRNRVNPESSLWRDVMDATGQPPLMKN
ncbi:MAG: ATP-dependent 6-phosphofructokinase [Chitinivibrionales bacterium]|nr:ATP-dependent 6-phosphofructokinase [Chitinivibrionales bacterium]MBD3396803.1 ATP-dependent 6-phosphofructokinase [Chitinivibrionales bacterium]